MSMIEISIVKNNKLSPQMQHSCSNAVQQVFTYIWC